MKVLIIEDDPINLKLAHMVLESKGYDVTDAESAEGAIEIIKDDKPQLILIDLKLSTIDGLQLTRKLRKDPDTKDIPIIAITAYSDNWTREDALEAGCDAYIIKPINTRTLLQQVVDVVSKGSESKK